MSNPVKDDDLLKSIIRQYRTDLASAHAEICKLQGLNPATHTWPEWSPQANSLRWLDKIEAAGWVIVRKADPAKDDDAELGRLLK